MALGTLYVIAAPSGAGKTSLVHALLETEENLIVSISHTTRDPRPGEQADVDYHFVSDAQFKNLLAENMFLEHATVHHHFYGTSKAWVMAHLQKGMDVILEIDWQGAAQVKRQFPASVSIFIMPPSWQELQNRLHARRQDSPEVIAERLAAANQEIAHAVEFDYWVVNEVFAHALADLQAIIRAQRLRTVAQQLKQAKLVAELLENR